MVQTRWSGVVTRGRGVPKWCGNILENWNPIFSQILLSFIFFLLFFFFAWDGSRPLPPPQWWVPTRGREESQIEEGVPTGRMGFKLEGKSRNGLQLEEDGFQNDVGTFKKTGILFFLKYYFPSFFSPYFSFLERMGPQSRKPSQLCVYGGLPKSILQVGRHSQNSLWCCVCDITQKGCQHNYCDIAWFWGHDNDLLTAFSHS